MDAARACYQMDGVEMKMAIMRKVVQCKDSDAKEVEDSTLKRFLIARDLDVNKAANFLLKHLAWKREAIPKGFISESEIQNEIAQKEVFSQGFDKMGRPIGVLIGHRHDPSNRDLNEFKRFAVFVIEKICSRMQRNEGKFIFIVDLQGWGYSNLDIRGYLVGLDILQIERSAAQLVSEMSSSNLLFLRSALVIVLLVSATVVMGVPTASYVAWMAVKLQNPKRIAIGFLPLMVRKVVKYTPFQQATGYFCVIEFLATSTEPRHKDRTLYACSAILLLNNDRRLPAYLVSFEE